MSEVNEAFRNHVKSGLTTLCRCWAINRADGSTYGFTDHDCDLDFEDVTFKADTGLNAKAVQQSTGLSVDNTEAMGVLSDLSVSEKDIDAGRFDGAELRIWLVNWQETNQRWLQFRGTIGELRRSGGAFHAELRGLTESLNQPQGRIFQKPCTAVLGDAGCRFDTTQPGFCQDLPVEIVEDGRVFTWTQTSGFAPGWFQRGKLQVETGPSAGLWGTIKRDREENSQWSVELWEPIRGGIAAGDMIKLIAGCDKRMETCRLKFSNILNFQGFPDIPAEDWVMAVPKRSGVNSGGSRR
ncbi:MAG: DUF2163 domain-containing protein [Pseudomonadota bacterium]